MRKRKDLWKLISSFFFGFCFPRFSCSCWHWLYPNPSPSNNRQIQPLCFLPILLSFFFYLPILLRISILYKPPSLYRATNLPSGSLPTKPLISLPSPQTLSSHQTLPSHHLSSKIPISVPSLPSLYQDTHLCTKPPTSLPSPPSLYQATTSLQSHHLSTKPPTSLQSHHLSTKPPTSLQSHHLSTKPPTSLQSHHLSTKPSMSLSGHPPTKPTIYLPSYPSLVCLTCKWFFTLYLQYLSVISAKVNSCQHSSVNKITRSCSRPIRKYIWIPTIRIVTKYLLYI